MAANTTLLIAVAAMAVLLLAGILAMVVYKKRTEGETIRDRAEKNARDIRHREALAGEHAGKAHAAQFEVDVKTAWARRCNSKRAPRQPTGSPRKARLWHAAG